MLMKCLITEFEWSHFAEFLKVKLQLLSTHSHKQDTNILENNVEVNLA